MVVIIPMAGRGSRYASRGFEVPKPLVEVSGKPMVLWAIEGLRGIDISKFIFVILQDHEDHFHISRLLTRNVSGPAEFVFLKNVTEGQLCTVLAAKHLIADDEDVLIAASDTLVIDNIQKAITQSNWAGIISVADLPGEQWSFAKTNEQGEVVHVAEKQRISDHASTGLYYFRRAKDLISFGEGMICNEERTRGEYYIIPVYQKLIEAGLKIGISKAEAMWDMGTPEAKEKFEKEYLSARSSS